jgi:hypothetical protein
MHIFAKRSLTAALIMLAVPAAIPAAANAAGIGHSFFMRGSVVDMTNGVPTICIGKADGATTGQVLDVYRVKAGPGPKGGFTRINVGSVRIDSIVDDHFATTSIVKGNVEKNDLVELRKN